MAPIFEPEESIGQQWHRLVGGATSWPRHPEAAVPLESVRGRLGVMFRALGGPGGVRLMAAGAAVSGHRLGLRQRLGLGATERLETPRFDGATLELPEDFNPADVAVVVDVCGASASFTLDKRGRAKGANGAISVKRSKSGWTLSASLKDLTWPNQWTEAGVEDWTSHKGSVEMPVTVTVGGETFTGADLIQVNPSAKGAAGK